MQDQCSQAGLRGCSELTEGILLYVEGKQEAGRVRIARGAAQNAPEDVKRYAALVRALGELPGASSYAAPLVEIASLLETDRTGHENATATSGGADATNAATSSDHLIASGSASGSPVSVLTADTDPAQIRDGVAGVPRETPPWCARHFGASATCRVLVHGPLTVTNVLSSRHDCAGQSLAVLRASRPRIVFETVAQLRDTRVALAAQDLLVLVQHSPPTPSAVAPSAMRTDSSAQRAVSAASTIVLEESDPTSSCELYWNGFAPYGAKPAPPADVDALLDY